MRWLFGFVFYFVSTLGFSQKTSYIPADIDVLQYNFDLILTDESDLLAGVAEILVRQKKKRPEITLDLINMNSLGKGMTVSGVWCNGRKAVFTHENNRLTIQAGESTGQDSVLLIKTIYSGIPQDGLIISTNKYGHRSFFGDNWPNRARHWLPCNDHPSDKSPVKFRVTAPQHYQVVSNGIKTEETNNQNGTNTTTWSETTPIPTKVMVIGMANFAVSFAGMVNCIPVHSWLFPEDREKGFYDYAQALDVLPFFIDQVGPYPFAKLANVQSKTIFGGMENAGCIFYYENSVNGERREEGLFAHEIAHQWFGNSATEISWHHMWLSEGFATYMTSLYMEKKYGTDTLRALLRTQRKEVLEFSVSAPERPVIDSNEIHFMKLLNANTYQKGGWFLHMLRRKMGDAGFWKAVRTYYKTYAHANATTDDFRRICEEVSAMPMDKFFQQWLRQPGQPVLEIKYTTKQKGLVRLTIFQKQPVEFEFPLDLTLVTAAGNIQQQLLVNSKTQSFSLPVNSPVSNILVDPNTDLLAGWTLIRVK